MTEKNWFYKVDGKHLGPLAVKDIFDLYHQGQIQDETYLWRMGQKDWVPLHQLEEIYLALHPEHNKKKGGVVGLSQVLPPEDIVRQTRDEIEREIPTPDLEPLMPMGSVPKPPAHFQLDSDSGKSIEVPGFSTNEMSGPDRSFDVEDGPPSLASLGLHETVEGIEESKIDLQEKIKSEESHQTAKEVAMESGETRDNKNGFTTAIIAFVAMGFVLSIFSVAGLRFWQWYRPKIQVYQELGNVPAQKNILLSKDGSQLFIRSESIATEEAKIELSSQAWYNQSHTAVQLSLSAKQLGQWIIVEDLKSGQIPEGIYNIRLELWSYDWITKIIGKITNEAAIFPGGKKVVEKWQGQYTTMIDNKESSIFSDAELVKIQEQYKTRYEGEVLSGIRESLLNLKTIQGLWDQTQQLFSQFTSMSEFEKTYAQNIAPVFQAISQDLQLPEKKLLGQNVLLEICRDFGQAVVLMSDYLQVNEILAKIEAAKKIKPKKGTKVPLIQLPKKSPDVLQAELRAMSAKIDGSILALQRDWEEQIQNKEIKE
jgi:hypothetical protein